MESDWRIDTVDGVPVARCVRLLAADGLVHGFSLRAAPGDPWFDLGTADCRAPEVLERRRRFLRAVGLPEGEVAAVMHQVHGAAVVEASPGDPPEADGALWVRGQTAGAVPAVRTADCIAIVLADRRGRAAACLHAGWRGTAAAIARRGVEALAEAGIPAKDLLAALGPAIRSCCYEVGEDVAAAVGRASRDDVAAAAPGRPGKRLLDLHAANRAQLATAGVPPGSILAAPWCTRCRSDLFFSFRGEGQRAGRGMAVAGPCRRP